MGQFLNTSVLSSSIMAHPPIEVGDSPSDTVRTLVNKNHAQFNTNDRLFVKNKQTSTMFELSAKGKNNGGHDILLTLDKLGSINGQPVAQVLFDGDAINTGKKHDLVGGISHQRQYTLVSPDGRKIKHKHNHRHPTYTFEGNTTITTNFSGVEVTLKTTHGEEDTIGGDTTVTYLLSTGETAAAVTARSTHVLPGLSSNKQAFVGPEHLRRRAVGII
jgi:hypothetical protein